MIYKQITQTPKEKKKSLPFRRSLSYYIIDDYNFQLYNFTQSVTNPNPNPIYLGEIVVLANQIIKKQQPETNVQRRYEVD